MHTRHQLPLRGLLSLTLVAGLQMASSVSAAEVKNVIILIPDGMSQSIQTLGRWYRGERLALDEMGAGTMAAWMVNSITTDSAPAGTAMATGYKSTDKFIGVGPKEDNALTTYKLPDQVPGATDAEKWNWFSYRPLATVMEGAKRQGKATGLVSTSRVTHATPASYAAHVDSRSLENDIAEQLVYQNLDVVFGGGWDRLLPTAAGGSRTDGEDLEAVLKSRGYQYVKTADELTALSGGKAWGLFSEGAMMPDIDRQYSCENEQSTEACNEPTLAEMTAKAIELLSKNENGFILMVEGSQVDWAGHANDPAYMLHDFLAFDDAVRVALEFAKHPGTMLLAAPDHNTGGLSLGNRSVNWTYTDITVEDLLDPLKGMQTTAEFIAGKLAEGRDPTPLELQDAVFQYWGITLSDEDAEWIIEYEKDEDVYGYGYSIATVVSERHTILGWTSHGHTGEDLPFWSYGTNAPVGHIDNTDFAWIVAEAFGLNLDLSHPEGLNQALFSDVKAQLPSATATLGGTTENPVLTISEPKKEQFERLFELPANKDFIIWRPFENAVVTCSLDGVIVNAPKANDGEGRWFAPQKAIEVMQTPVRSCLLSSN